MRSAHHVDTRRLRSFNGIDSEIYIQVSIYQYTMTDIRVAKLHDFIYKQVMEIMKLTSIFHYVSCLAYKRHFLSRQIAHYSFIRLTRAPSSNHFSMAELPMCNVGRGSSSRATPDLNYITEVSNRIQTNNSSPVLYL